MKSTSVRVRRTAALSVGPLAVLLAGAFVWQGSQAAFTDHSRNSGSAWSAGQVVLQDDDLGAAAFTVEKIIPQQVGTKCLKVTSQSNVSGQVRFYVQHLVALGLEDYVRLTVAPGTGGSFSDCTGFTPDTTGTVGPLSLKTLATGTKDFATGVAPWNTAGTAGESKSYRLSWVFDTAGLTQAQIDGLQGAKNTVDFVWELQTS